MPGSSFAALHGIGLAGISNAPWIYRQCHPQKSEPVLDFNALKP
jgi:hypothetical protein